jgi:hypothetical protein
MRKLALQADGLRNTVQEIVRRADMLRSPHEQSSHSPRSFCPMSHELELKRMIAKLKWIGLEREAEQLTRALTLVSPTACLLLVPPDTD